MDKELLTLLYPLGYLSSVLFSLRFLVQWLQSERRKASYVTPAFWRLSFAGNLMLLLHALLQMQYHVAIVQTVNGVISWRNLDLMTSKPKSLQLTLACLFLSSLFTTAYFAFISPEWFASPGADTPLHNLWHLFGFIGIVLFSLRFVIQWWQAERDQESRLGVSFWVISVAGGILSLIYFVLLKDPVNAIGPLMGLIPYVRNLMLIYRRKLA